MYTVTPCALDSIRTDQANCLDKSQWARRDRSETVSTRFEVSTLAESSYKGDSPLLPCLRSSRWSIRCLKFELPISREPLRRITFITYCLKAKSGLQHCPEMSSVRWTWVRFPILSGFASLHRCHYVLAFKLDELTKAYRYCRGRIQGQLQSSMGNNAAENIVTDIAVKSSDSPDVRLYYKHRHLTESITFYSRWDTWSGKHSPLFILWNLLNKYDRVLETKYHGRLFWRGREEKEHFEPNTWHRLHPNPDKSYSYKRAREGYLTGIIFEYLTLAWSSNQFGDWHDPGTLPT